MKRDLLAIGIVGVMACSSSESPDTSESPMSSQSATTPSESPSTSESPMSTQRNQVSVPQHVVDCDARTGEVLSSKTTLGKTLAEQDT